MGEKIPTEPPLPTPSPNACSFCPDGWTPENIEVTFNGVTTPTGCINNGIMNNIGESLATYIVPQTAACSWNYDAWPLNLGEWWYYPYPGCGGDPIDLHPYWLQIGISLYATGYIYVWAVIQCTFDTIYAFGYYGNPTKAYCLDVTVPNQWTYSLYGGTAKLRGLY